MYLSIEEYMAKRKRQDFINEFDPEQRVRNMGLCISYVVDYYEKYIDPKKIDTEHAARSKKTERLQKQFSAYDKDIVDWLSTIYMEHGKRLDISVKSYLKTDVTYLLRYETQLFDFHADDFINQYKKQLPFICSEKARLMRLMDGITKEKNKKSCYTFDDYPQLGNTIIAWLKNTFNGYGINLMVFAEEYASEFFSAHTAYEYNREYDRVDTVREYDYKTNGTNLFEIDDLYEKVKEFPFLNNRKTELELIIMAAWLTRIVSDQKYWPIYLSKNKDRRSKVGAADTSNLILVQYQNNPFPEPSPCNVKLIEAHFDVETISETGRYVLRTEYSYGRRKFTSKTLNSCNSLLQTQKNGIPILWVNKEWALALADLIKKQTKNASEPELIEICPPFKTTISELDKFVELYRYFEDELKRSYPNANIVVANRFGAMQRDLPFLVSSVDDMQKLSRLISKRKLNLRLSVDFSQLFSAHSKTDWFFRSNMPKLFGKIKEFRDHIECIHVLGKMRSSSNTITTGNFLKYFKDNEDQRDAFLHALAYVFDDALPRYFIPEINGYLQDTSSVLEDLKSVGFSFKS